MITAGESKGGGYMRPDSSKIFNGSECFKTCYGLRVMSGDININGLTLINNKDCLCHQSMKTIDRSVIGYQTCFIEDSK